MRVLVFKYNPNNQRCVTPTAAGVSADEGMRDACLNHTVSGDHGTTGMHDMHAVPTVSAVPTAVAKHRGGGRGGR